MAANWSIPSVIDIQDQWPDTFLRAFPRSMRPLARLLLGHWYILERDAYRNADAITGVAKGYLDRGLSVGGSKAQAGVFPLGVDLHVFENKLSKSPSGAPCRRNVGEGLPKFIYSGSLSHSYDVHTILDAVLLLRRTSGLRFEVLISGAGESESDLRKFADKHGLSNVRFLGFLEFEDWLSELVQCDIGFNAAHSDALIYMPNKLFYYLGAGLAVLNTIPGECAELIASHECGFSYAAGDAAACATAITNLIRSPNMLRNMRASSRRLALSLFDRTVISRDLVKFLENVALTTR
jgi:glycosyltransferase involved in cell wall biosynthesis